MIGSFMFLRNLSKDIVVIVYVWISFVLLLIVLAVCIWASLGYQSAQQVIHGNMYLQWCNLGICPCLMDLATRTKKILFYTNKELVMTSCQCIFLSAVRLHWTLHLHDSFVYICAFWMYKDVLYIHSWILQRWLNLRIFVMHLCLRFHSRSHFSKLDTTPWFRFWILLVP